MSNLFPPPLRVEYSLQLYLLIWCLYSLVAQCTIPPVVHTRLYTSPFLNTELPALPPAAPATATVAMHCTRVYKWAPFTASLCTSSAAATASASVIITSSFSSALASLPLPCCCRARAGRARWAKNCDQTRCFSGSGRNDRSKARTFIASNSRSASSYGTGAAGRREGGRRGIGAKGCLSVSRQQGTAEPG